jgi:hypothetical protein
MAKFKIENFGGELPAVDNRLMPENAGAQSINTWLMSGRLEPLHALVPIHTMRDPSARSFFRLPIANPGIDNMVDSYWLEFVNQNVRVIRSPVTGQDDNGRYYWADGVYPKFMTGDMIKNANQLPPVAPFDPYKLGIPQPSVPPGVTSSGGVSTINQTRVDSYTWVSGAGEEGPPAPPTLHTGKLDDTWHITVTAPTALDTANRNLTHTRIYRSVTGVQGVASYFMVVELPIATLTYDDNLSDALITLNEELGSLDWYEPPADLQGLVSMPNGMVAGWRKNEVWFCEPYYPHAWPLKYMIAVPNDIVCLGVLGQTLLILTEGNPWSATGIEPSAMALAIIQPLEPCTSRLSLVNTPNAVLYSSPNGLINITASGAQNITKDFILKDQWYGLLHLASVCAAILSNCYYAYSIDTPGVFQEDTFQVLDQPATVGVIDTAFQPKSHFGTRQGIILSLSDPRVGLTVLEPGVSIEVANLMNDMFNGEAMTLRNGVVYLVDLRNEQNQTKYIWRSKMFQTQYLSNLGAAKVYWTPAVPTTQLGEPNDTVFRMYAGERSDLVEDGLPLRFEETMTKSGQMFRLPSGYKALYHQFEVEGYAFIDAIHVASTARELRDI